MAKIPWELRRELLRELLMKSRPRETGDCAWQTPAAQGIAPPIREKMAVNGAPPPTPPSPNKTPPPSRTPLRRPRKNSAGLRRWHASLLRNFFVNWPAGFLANFLANFAAKLRPTPEWTLILFLQSANCQTGQPAPDPNRTPRPRPSPARTIRGEEWTLRQPSTAAPRETRDGIPSASAEVPRVGRRRAMPGIAPEKDCRPACRSAPSAQSGWAASGRAASGEYQ